MIEIKDVPKHILEVARFYQKKGENLDVFPSKFYVDGDYFYFFTFAVGQQLIVREDGAILSLDQIRKVGLFALAYNSSVESLVNTGIPWAESSTKKHFQKIYKLLKKVKQKIGKDTSPQTLKDLEDYINLAKITINLQDEIFNAVEKGKELVRTTNEKEIVTEEDRDLLRKYTIQYVLLPIIKMTCN